MNCVLISVETAAGDAVARDQVIATVEAMKMQYSIKAPADGVVKKIVADVGDTLVQGELICEFDSAPDSSIKPATQNELSAAREDRTEFQHRIEETLDAGRADAVKKRHAKGYRTARENLNDLIDAGSFNEYGQLAVAAQRSRIPESELRAQTAADGVITGTASINRELVGERAAQSAVIVNDYTVLAGTQGYFHHHKLDRILELAGDLKLPVVMYTEGGGGRPGDTDAQISMAGLNVASFKTWAGLSGLVPRIAVNNGYCFAGNAALFGCADITIATKTSWIGMAGPAMIEGGGLGKFAPTQIGDIEIQASNGVVDLVAEDEKHATELAQKVLSYFQGTANQFRAPDPSSLRELVPAERRSAYQVRDIINAVVDQDSFTELRQPYGVGIVTAFARIAGRAIGVLANDCHHLGGAVDAIGAAKAARFLQLCDAFGLPIVSFADTPGFMVGPESETQAAVRNMSSLFVTAASVSIPMVAIILRKGYGLGAMAMTGGSTHAPVYTAAWPSGEFGAMGLEGAVRLGFKKELAAVPEGEERDALFNQYLQAMIDQGKAVEAAAYLEIDAVIDPAETRATIVRALNASMQIDWRDAQRRNFVDTR